MKKIFIFYSAGSAGALIQAFIGWSATQYGIIRNFSSTYGLPLSLHSLYPSLVWGGLWALLCIPLGLRKLNWFQAGFLVALFPTAAQLFYFFPHAGAGYLGLVHGNSTPLIVLGLHLIWGWSTTLMATYA